MWKMLTLVVNCYERWLRVLLVWRKSRIDCLECNDSLKTSFSWIFKPGNVSTFSSGKLKEVFEMKHQNEWLYD